jgi:hypothetical protein
VSRTADAVGNDLPRTKGIRNSRKTSAAISTDSALKKGPSVAVTSDQPVIPVAQKFDKQQRAVEGNAKTCFKRRLQAHPQLAQRDGVNAH